MTTAPTTTAGRRSPIGAGRGHSWLLLITGLLGLAASAVLTLDKIKLLKDPS